MKFIREPASANRHPLTGMNITAIETFSTEFVGMVKVTTDTGDAGWGVEVNPQWLRAARHYKSAL